jgi:hypothetical protein
MSIRLRISAVLITGAWLPAGALADIIKLPGQAAAVVALDNAPEYGMRMAQVEQRYGAPQTRGPAVGQPPITRWEYQHYTVYVEGDRVVHSVARPAH